MLQDADAASSWPFASLPSTWESSLVHTASHSTWLSLSRVHTASHSTWHIMYLLEGRPAEMGNAE